MDIIFIDANIFFSALYSNTGASFGLFQLAKKKKVKIVTNHYVLLEAIRNCREKIGQDRLPELYKMISLMHNVELSSVIEDLIPLINSKDLPVLSGALNMKVDFLITLDKKGFMNPTIFNANLPFRILTPGQYIKAKI